MNHSKVVYITNHTTLDLGHRKFAVDIPLAFGLGYIYCKLPLTSVLGSIFAIYASLLWFTYNIHIYIYITSASAYTPKKNMLILHAIAC